MIPLKTCPFCGGRAVYSRIPGQGFSILCQSCGAIAMYGNSQQQDALGTAWNRRTSRPNFSVQSAAAPCPFCSSRMGVGQLEAGSAILKCASCGMMVGFASSDDVKTSVSLWNRRV